MSLNEEGGVIDASFVQCAGADGINAFLIADVVVVHMSVNLCFRVEGTKVEDILFVCLEYEVIAGSKQVVVKKNKRLIFLHQGEVILQPVVYIPLRAIGRVVSVVDGSNDIMHVADIERIPCRAINRFIKFFAVVAFHQVVVAYAVIDGAVHCLCIHNLIVHCESRFVADVSGMNQKSQLFVLYVLL